MFSITNPITLGFLIFLFAALIGLFVGWLFANMLIRADSYNRGYDEGYNQCLRDRKSRQY